MVKDNVKLASFIVSALERAPKGVPQIDVTFEVDLDGILHVTGIDLRTGNRKEVTITNSVRLSDEEIAAMIRQAAEDVTSQLRHCLEDHTHPLSDALTSAIKAVLASAPLANAPEKDWSAYLSIGQDLYRQVQEAAKSIQAKQ